MGDGEGMPTRFIVVARSACISRTWMGSRNYMNVAVVEVDTDELHELGRREPYAIDTRSRGVVRVVRVWEKVYRGRTSECGFARAVDEAEDLAAAANQEWYDAHPDQLESDKARAV